jgi:hypothetical protein
MNPRNTLAMIMALSSISSMAAADAGSFYDDKYLYSDQDLIVLEQVYKAGKEDGETIQVLNIADDSEDVKDLSTGTKQSGYYADTGKEKMNTVSGSNNDELQSGSSPVLSKGEVAANVSDQVKGITKASHNKIRKELIIPGNVDPMLLELDRFLNAPLTIEQSKPVNMLEIIATTIPQGWRVYFSNTTTEDYIDEYEFFVPTVPRAKAFAKLEEAFGVQFKVMNQPESPYVIVNKIKGAM